MAKTLNERIAETQEKISQYENQVKRLIQQQKQAERKARTRRLIERGALLESLIDRCETLTTEEVKAVLTAAIKSGPAVDVLLPILQRQNAAVPTKAKTAQEAPILRKRNTEATKKPEALQNSGA